MSYVISSVAMRSNGSVRKNQNRVRIVQKSGIGPVSNLILLGIILAVLGLMYLTQISKTNAFSYEVNTLEEERSALIEEQENLLVETARLQSIERLKSSEVAKQLEPASSVEYIQ